MLILKLDIMINFTEYKLDNGLTVILHKDPATPLAVVNLLYRVGSRDEDPDMTGFAHLMEHLMFGGSKNVPDFDAVLQRAGADNNAFTNTDITNYYVTIPVENLETALWLESDRMLHLSFNPKILETQKNVVIEEYKQRYLDQPYGDVWLQIRPLAYHVHPYRWPTIGMDIAHIEKAEMDDVRNFFRKHYHPGNATLVVAGNIHEKQTVQLVEKWFGDIPAGPPAIRDFPAEPPQKSSRMEEVERPVPLDALFRVYHMPGRNHASYYAIDMLSDILGRGKSSRLYTGLVKDRKIFDSVSAFILGSFDPGLLVISGKLNPGHSPEEGNRLVNEILEELLSGYVKHQELEKVKNQAESNILFSEMELLNRAMGLAISNALGHTNLVNEELEKIRSVTTEDILNVSQETLKEKNCSTLFYRKSPVKSS